MEPRKLISFGNSSYIISLPKAWVNRHDLGKGDFVYCFENGNDEIVIAPQEKEIKKEIRKVAINVGKKTFKEVKREIISNYIAGYDIIRVESNQNLKFYKELRDSIRDFTTMDITDQGKNLIVAKDFLNLERISLEDLTRRMDLIIRSMMEDTKHYDKKLNLEKIYNMDNEINRITFMLFRFIKKALNDPRLAKSFGLASENLLTLWLMVSHLEKFADEIKRVAKFFKVLNIKRADFEELLYIYALIEKEYLTTMKSYYNKNKDLAFNVASNKDEILEKCNKLLTKSNIAITGSVIEKFKSMEHFIVFLARDIYEQN